MWYLFSENDFRDDMCQNHFAYTIFVKWFCHMSSLQSILQNKYDMATEIDDMASEKIWHG